MTRIKIDIAIIIAWFALAIYVAIRLVNHSAAPGSTLASWLGGVLSVFFAQFLYHRWMLIRRG